jgi:hypothetical protein
MTSLHPQNIFLNLILRLSINIVLAVVLLDFGDFLILEVDVFVPVLSLPLLLSIESPSKEDCRFAPLRGEALSCVDRP